MSDTYKIAINAALRNDWNQAILLNREILKENPNDINALNRYAFACIQTCDIDEAKKIYKKILTVDKYNIIALKNLEKIKNYQAKKSSKSSTKSLIPTISPSLFLEEPGKTKTITLANPASSDILSSVNIGDPVVFHPKKHSIDIRDRNNKYLGALPDDIAFRLIRLIKCGNTYRANIKNITKNSITVFLCETGRGRRFANQPSFLTSIIQKGVHSSHPKITAEDPEDEGENKQAQAEDDV